MKQITKCVMHDNLVRLSDSYVVEINETGYDTSTGKRTDSKYKARLCKQCALDIGYKPKSVKSDKARNVKKDKTR